MDFEIPVEEHLFAPYVRILGKGKSGSRSLTREEARQAFTMILNGEAQPLQIGAFLMLLRVKEETGEELAGFVDACRATMQQPAQSIQVDLDWSSYAGKKHQHPWYLLSLLLLSKAGYRILVHGSDGHTQGRLYTEQSMRALGLPVASDWNQAEQQLNRHNLSYLPLRYLCQPLHQLMQLRPLLGLRSPVNTLTRMLNPLQAEASIQSIFHPAYSGLHQDCDRLLGQPRALVLKGDSGEIEVKPQADTRLQLFNENKSSEILMPRSIQEKVPPVTTPTTEPLSALWQGESEDEYGIHALLSTTAAALLCLEPDFGLPRCLRRAEELWQNRDKRSLT